ncbi:unnamed protein product [Rotaria sp. Silwood2]|nr:unnamed protein product [Rotaria sp. Silwood2]CAF4460815.1 unnamed protein product [Rotaria sp. Silwood2]
MITKALQHALKKGSGSIIPRQHFHRARVSFNRIKHFMDFLFDHDFVQDVAYGTTKIRTMNETFTIPLVVKKCINSHIVYAYDEYCQQISFKRLSNRSLYRVLNECKMSQRKSLAGLDDYTAGGTESFDVLENLVTSLPITKYEQKRIIMQLHEAKRYLKNGFSLNLSLQSNVASHCVNFALSDSDSKSKDQCDRESTCTKTHRDYYISAGNSVTTALQMKQAAEWSGGVKDTKVAVVNIEENGTKLNPAKQSSQQTKPSSKKSSILFCSNLHCVSTFADVKELEQHLKTSQHEYLQENTDAQSLSITEKAKISFIDHLKGASNINNSTTHSVASISTSSTTKNSLPNSIWMDRGWAQQKRSMRISLSIQQIKFLNKLYERGEKSKKKVSAAEAADLMRTESDNKNNKLFRPHQYLNKKQIANYFSSKTANRRKSLQSLSSAVDEEINDDDEDEDTAQRQQQRLDDDEPVVTAKASYYLKKTTYTAITNRESGDEEEESDQDRHSDGSETSDDDTDSDGGETSGNDTD